MSVLLRLLAVLALAAALLTAPTTGIAPATAAAPTCGSLTVADLSFDAPLLAGDAPAGGACWTLPLTAGDVLRVAASADDGPRWTVTDADGAILCVTQWATPAECTVSGPAPYVLALGNGSWPSVRYAAQVVRLSDPQGCSTLVEASPGTTVAPTPGPDLAPGQVACWRGNIAEPGLRLLGADAGTKVELRSDNGLVVCQGRSRPCAVSSGDTTLLLHAKTYEATARRAGLMGLAAVGSCPTLTTDWSSQPVAAPPSSLKVDCRAFESELGEVVAFPTSHPSTLRISDAAGADACAPGTPKGICTLTSPGPHRLLSWYAGDSPWSDDSYLPGLFVRSVTHHVGCPTLAPSGPDATGTVPEAEGCRVLAVEETGPHLIDAGDDHPMTVVDDDGAGVCFTGAESCRLSADQDYVLVGAPFRPDEPQAVLRRLDDDGCPTLADDPGAVWTIPAGMRAAACATLAQPAGATVIGVRPAGEGRRYGRVLDAAGTVACAPSFLTDRPCVLKGEAPFRVVRHGDDESSRMSFVRLDQPSGCDPLPGGAFGTEEGADVSLPDGQFLGCLTVPRTDLSGETIFAVARRSGDGVADVEIRDAHPGRCASENGAGVTAMSYCQIYEPASLTTTVLLRGDGRPGTWRVVRRPRGGDESCRATTAAEVGGRAVTGRLSSFLALDCWTVSAAESDRMVFDLHGRDNDVAVNVTGSGGRTCDDDGFDTCALTGSSSYRVVVRDRGFRDTVPDYELTVGTTARGSAASDSCAPVPPAGRSISHVLDVDRTAICLLLPTGSRYALRLGPGVEPVSIDARLGNDRGVTCARSDDGWNCSGPSSGAPDPHGMLLLHRQDGQSRTVLEATLECTLCPAPAPDVMPSIVGTPQPGSLLRADLGSWTPTPDSLEYRWSVGEMWAPEDGPTFHVLPEHVGQQINLHVQARFRGRLTAVRVWVDVAEVPEPPVSPMAPVSGSAPRLTGEGRVGTVLRASPGTWLGHPQSLAYRWLADGKSIRGQDAPSLVVGPTLLGRRLSVEVVATNHVGSATARSATVLVRPGAAPTVVRRPRLSGRPRTGRIVRIVGGTWSRRPAEVAYVWKAGSRTLAVTGPQLRLPRTLAGKRVNVTIVARAPGYDDGRTSLSFRVRRR